MTLHNTEVEVDFTLRKTRAATLDQHSYGNKRRPKRAEAAQFRGPIKEDLLQEKKAAL